MAKKELTGYFFNPLGYLSAGVLITLCNWLFFKDLFLINQVSMVPYWTTATFLISLFIPVMTMGLFADEKRNGTWEVLMSLPLRMSDIVWGKFIGSVLFILFILLLSVPVAVTMGFIGMPQIGMLIGGYLGMILLSIAYLSLGLFVSSLCAQPLIAFLITFVALVLNNFLAQFKMFTNFSLAFRGAKFSAGLIDFGDLFFFISWILIFVIGTIIFKSTSWRKKKINFATVNFLIILILANIFLSFYPSFKFDLTKDKVHSLSPATKLAIINLEDIINVKVFLSPNLPVEVKPAVDKLKAILDEFERVNRAKLMVNYVDPDKDKEALTMATSLGIKPLQFNTVKKDKFEVQNGYMAVVLIYGQKQQVLNLDLQNLEYLIISGIKNILAMKEKIVALYQDPSINTGSTQDNLKYFKQYLNKDYAIQYVDIFDGSTLPQEAKSLIIYGLSKKLDTATMTKIREWTKAKKGLISFVDRVLVDDNMQSTPLEKTGLEMIYAEAGINILDKLVLDESAGTANFTTPNGLVMSQYQFWPLIKPENINNKIPVMSGIDSVQLDWASPLEVTGKASTLFSGSKRSGVTDNLSNLAPTTKIEAGNFKQLPLAAINIEDGNKLAIVGDADFLKNNFIASNDRNLYFALNLVDYFSSDSSLMTIRTKTLRISPIKEIDDDQKLLIRIINLAIPILILALSGFFVYKRRLSLNLKNYEN